MKRLGYYYCYLLVAWGVFRYTVSLPEVVEELWFKPAIWLLPLFWWQLSMGEKRVLMFASGNLRSVLWGSVICLVYFLVIKRIDWRIGNLSVEAVGVALATAVTEELVFSGFVTPYLGRYLKKGVYCLLTVGLMVAVMRLPLLFFGYELGGGELLGAMLLAGSVGVINAWIRVETGSVLGSVVARMGFNLAVLV